MNGSHRDALIPKPATTASEDRGALAARNQARAAARHQEGARQKIRRLMLYAARYMPRRRPQPPLPGTVLLVRPDHLGDMLMTLPAIDRLSETRPDLRLSGLAGPWGADVWGVKQGIDQVLTVPFPGFTRGGRAGNPWQPYIKLWQWAQHLQALRAEYAVIMRPDHWWGAWLCQLAGIPNRIGYGHPDVRPFLTEVLPWSGQESEHAVLQNARLFSRWYQLPNGLLPAEMPLRYPLDMLGQQDMDALRDRYMPIEKPYAVIHPGAGTVIKSWPPAYWAAVADRLCSTYGLWVIFTGGKAEQALIAPVLAAMREKRLAFSLAGQTTLNDLATLYAGAKIVLGPDTGPLHLAAACGTPTVHLYGPADPAIFGPWGSPERHKVLTSDIACRPCRILDWGGDDPKWHPCVRDITPLHVLNAVADILKA
jgi:ADP-heptose:LPS heptosyltransferase